MYLVHGQLYNLITYNLQFYTAIPNREVQGFTGKFL